MVALLVGWLLVWANDPDGPNATWLALGSIAFAGVLTLLGMLFAGIRASQRLRQTEAAFLTGASHNLRTPLSALRTAAQTLRDADLDEADRALLIDALLHETGRLELRVDNLLETARLDLERRAFVAEAIAIEPVVSAVLEEARWAFTAAGGRVTCEDDGTNPRVVGDRRALKLMFENLVDNAIKYAVGPPQVDVSISRSDEHTVVRVADHGIGFESDEAEALFVRFHRGDTGRPGTGLGLSLARAIARGHGGEMRIVSDGPGQGATAEVWLPSMDVSERQDG